MSTIAGSRNTLLGYGAALPNAAASNQIVIGTQAETTYIATGAGGGVVISQSALTLSGNTALTVSGNAGTAGQYMVSGGTGQAPYWGPKAPQSLTGVSWTLANPLSNLYTIQGSGTNSWNLALPGPAAAAGSSIWVKNMASASGAVSPSIVNQDSTDVVSNVMMLQGDSASFLSDGASWYVVSASENLVTNPLYVSSVTPATGSEAGGTALTLTGTGFTGATAVTIGGVPVSRFNVTNGGTTITTVTPAGTLGSASVVVVAPLGTSLPNQLYTYAFTSPTSFAYTGVNQTFVVPLGVTQVTATVAGSVGTNADRCGAGAIIVGTIGVSPGDTLTIVCGGYPGYAGATNGSGGGEGAGGGGGGYSAILTSAANCNSIGQPTYPPGSTPTGILIMSGGGGGGVNSYSNYGGSGGSWDVVNSSSIGGNSVNYEGGGSATGGQTTNEAGEGQPGIGAAEGGNGSIFQGGSGYFGGGGGSGYYGGGGGGVLLTGYPLAGGGGSSYVNTTAVSGITNSANGGLGYVTLEWT